MHQPLAAGQATARNVPAPADAICARLDEAVKAHHDQQFFDSAEGLVNSASAEDMPRLLGRALQHVQPLGDGDFPSCQDLPAAVAWAAVRKGVAGLTSLMQYAEAKRYEYAGDGTEKRDVGSGFMWFLAWTAISYQQPTETAETKRLLSARADMQLLFSKENSGLDWRVLGASAFATEEPVVEPAVPFDALQSDFERSTGRRR